MKGSSVNLSKRLEAVKDTVKPCDVSLDIGCDHGYVSIALVKEKVAGKVICLDINEGPLKAAQRNVCEAGVSDSIELRLSDGFEKVTADDKPDSVIIAGMGGRLTASILDGGKDIVKNLSQLVLEPQSEIEVVRAKVRELGFHIEKEKFLTERGKFYFIIDAVPGRANSTGDEEFYDKYSKYLIETNDTGYKEYVLKSIEKFEGYQRSIKDVKNGDLMGKIEELKKVIDLIEK